MKIEVNYPSDEDESKIMRLNREESKGVVQKVRPIPQQVVLFFCFPSEQTIT